MLQLLMPRHSSQVHHCNDFFTSQALQIVACLPALRTLRLEEVQCRLETPAVGQLSALHNVRSYSCLSLVPGESSFLL